MKTLFNNGWMFKKTDIDVPYRDALDSIGWRRVDIPHDWLIEQTKALYETGTGWYKKEFELSATGENVYLLYFDGVYMDTTVYVNGQKAGEWKYGYSSFEIDISGFVAEGTNTVVVKVCHRAPNSRWYSGAGIFRNVYLIEHKSAYIKSDSVYFSAKPLSDGKWKVELSSQIVGTNEGKVLYNIKTNDGELLASASSKIGEKAAFEVEKPALWSCKTPYLYTLETVLLCGENVADTFSCSVGFREIKFTPDEGFFLNGENIKLHGVCNHHDLGCLGAAVNRTALRRQLEIMREMGVNAIRTSHNMPAVELMELCDEMGILVDSEAFDMWELKKTDYDYARFFDEWYKKDVASWVCRDRNHPSVIMWSIGNEIYDTHASERGVEVTKMLRDEVRVHDYNCNAYTTIGSNYIAWEGAQKCAEELELSGYNYGEHLYSEHHEKYPHWCIYGSETASRVQSRGVYHFPKSAAYITHDDLQCSSLENCRAGVGDRTAQTSIIADRDTKFCAGQFIWTGFDYIGEPSPYSTKNSYFGQVDTAGYPKDSFYLYKAAWTDQPVLKLLPYWDFNPGQLIDVMVYTNQPEVELFFNGKSLGRKNTGNGYSADWQLSYEKGELRAVAYDKEGNITAEDTTRSFGDTAELRISADKTHIMTDGSDLIFLDIAAYDKDGNFTANARNRVYVNVSGAGRLVGLDSGDSTDYDEYKGTSKKLFGGRLLAVIAAKDRPGDINVTVTSRGLPDASLLLKAVEAERPYGTADAFTENCPSPENDEIPVRKIEIKADEKQLCADKLTASVRAEVYPENATYEIEWTAVTVNGVQTNIASVEDSGKETIVRAEGDGEFRLRCFCRNGKEAPEVISELEFSINGLGNVTVDPYSGLVKGSLYNASRQTLNEVSNGGVNIERNGKNAVGFRKVDFGSAGTEKLTVSLINWHSNEPLSFSLWLGMPWEEGSEKVGTFTYQADFIWQTYIENTFALPKRIKGLHDICFEFEESDKRISFGGFMFLPFSPYENIKAADYSTIWGDTYKVTGDRIEGIGNNVFINYEGMDLSEGAKSITICGKTRNSNDSIHIRFMSDNGDIRKIAEFPNSEELTEKTFDMGDIKGSFDIRLEFLPGCDFDLAYFRFNK